MKSTRLCLLLQGFPLIGYLLASPVSAGELFFIDGGYSELCSTAAFNQDELRRVEITGSRLGMDPIEICTRAIESQDGVPVDRAVSYNNRGVLYFTIGMTARALQDFEMAIQLQPKLAQAHVNRGYTLVVLELWAESIAAFNTGIELGTVEADKAFFNRGLAHEETGDLRQAYFDYQQAAELNPTWNDPKVELARFTIGKK